MKGTSRASTQERLPRMEGVGAGANRPPRDREGASLTAYMGTERAGLEQGV